MITQEKINKINEYAHRVKNGETLTPEELAERDELRREYIDAVVGNMKNTLDHTTVKYPDGTEKKLKSN